MIGHSELSKVFAAFTDSKDPIFTKYFNSVQKLAFESNVAARESATEVILEFVKHSDLSLRLKFFHHKICSILECAR